MWERVNVLSRNVGEGCQFSSKLEDRRPLDLNLPTFLRDEQGGQGRGSYRGGSEKLFGGRMVQGRRILSLGLTAVKFATRQCTEVQSLRGGFRGLPTAHGSNSRLWLPSNVSMHFCRSMSCCAKVDLPPPTEVTVEYHENSENTDYFIELADGIEDAHPDIMVTGNPEGMTPRDGAFEVTTGEYLLFSKLKDNRLPTLEDILRAIDERPTQALSCELEGAEKAANS